MYDMYIHTVCETEHGTPPQGYENGTNTRYTYWKSEILHRRGQPTSWVQLDIAQRSEEASQNQNIAGATARRCDITNSCDTRAEIREFFLKRSRNVRRCQQPTTNIFFRKTKSQRAGHMNIDIEQLEFLVRVNLIRNIKKKKEKKEKQDLEKDLICLILQMSKS